MWWKRGRWMRSDRHEYQYHHHLHHLHHLRHSITAIISISAISIIRKGWRVCHHRLRHHHHHHHQQRETETKQKQERIASCFCFIDATRNKHHSTKTRMMMMMMMAIDFNWFPFLCLSSICFVSVFCFLFSSFYYLALAVFTTNFWNMTVMSAALSLSARPWRGSNQSREKSMEGFRYVLLYVFKMYINT